ncbi:RNA-guided endonuclease InsQ/TnpB family protein [Planococcus salinus]|uniref:Transposase n=1 Tax=Planococcus salinus TaxID=1848460 RepID=A0A3M8P5Y9_9BACL|nr:RNA-guided endonuclease TnpB family protein [Planococcus salinus]RNF39098.1 transposase [Planococcus salinus]
MPILSIKLPLFEPTHAKIHLYEDMRASFSEACNVAIRVKRENPESKASEIDRTLAPIQLPSTLRQEARKLACSRYADWKKHTKTKGFPQFRQKIAIPFNNQNWHLRFDNGFLKLGVPTADEGRLTVEKYVPLKTNAYTLFWVNYLLSGEMDETSNYYNPSINPAIQPKKGSGQLFCKKGTWYFSFALSFEMKGSLTSGKAIGVDRGLKAIAVAGDQTTGEYLLFSGKRIGHVRRKFSNLRRTLMQKKNQKALKRLKNKEQRIIHYWNHVIAKDIVAFAKTQGASIIKIEDLKGIRSMKRYWKRSDRNVNSWAFFDLETKLAYKAELAELVVQKVSPFKTSQECAACGTTLKTNRRGSRYTCSCGYRHNADVNASFVIAARPPISTAVN